MRALLAVLSLLAAAASSAARAGEPADPRPDLTLSGEIGVRDLHRYVEVPFTTPPGVDRVTVVFAQDGAAQHTTIDLGLFDPQRFRGWSGGNKSRFTVGTADATPSYLPGPLPAGRWRLVLGVPNIRPGVTTHYQAKIYFGRPGETPSPSTFSDKPLRDAPGWYRGDLHDHTDHSDGSCLSRAGAKVPCPAFVTLEAADRRGLDFVVVSDHNTISQYDALRELQPYFDRTLIIPGRELTTFEGHANALGATDFIDFRLDGEHVRSADALIAATHKAGALFSINHPGVPSGEICMGCGWTAPVADPSKIDAVEVLNGGTARAEGRADGPHAGFAFWRAMLDRGLHPTAVGGSDSHDAELPADAGGLGTPTTVVYAQNLSERAILEGIRAGHVYIDVQGAKDRTLDFALTGAGAAAMMGDEAALGRGAAGELKVRVTGLPGGRIEWVSDAGLTLAAPSGGPLGADDVRSVAVTADGARHWVFVEARDAEGRLALVSNPIYLAPASK